MQEFTLAWLLAPMLCVVALPFAPALGGYLNYATSQADYPYVLVGAAWDFEPLISAIRSGELRHLGANPIVGVVTFPSFHAAGAVILGWCGRKAPGGAIVVGLNGAMLVSTIPIGGHYLIDVAGGILVAALALASAKALVSPRHFPNSGSYAVLGRVKRSASVRFVVPKIIKQSRRLGGSA